MMRYLDVPKKFPISLFRDNKWVSISITNPESELNNKHVTIHYHNPR